MEKDKKEEQTKPPDIDLDQKQHHITLKVDWQKIKSKSKWLFPQITF